MFTLEGSVKVSVYNILGTLVCNKDVVNNQLELSGLANGMYFLHIGQEGTTVTKKIIKL